MKAPKILAVASAIDLDFRYGCTPAWWQLWKGLYEVGADLIVTPYRGRPVESPWWRTAPNPTWVEGESFAAALTDPAAPAKSTQFYAMLGQRALYEDGWLACTLHPPLSGWGKFELDVWELYHVAEDRSESKDLAAEMPDRCSTLAASMRSRGRSWGVMRLAAEPLRKKLKWCPFASWLTK